MRTRGSQRGVSMVEFALICMLFFATIGFFIELSIAYFDYQLLVNATTTAARKVGVYAVLSTNSSTCAQIEDNSNTEGAAQRAHTILSQSFGISSDYFTPVRFCADIRVDTSVTPNRCYIRLRGKWPFKCFFCLFYKGGAVLSAEGESYIEDECFTCDVASDVGNCLQPRTDTTGNGINCVTGQYSDGVPG